jgi:molybdenum cofactor cytidylyltransferase
VVTGASAAASREALRGLDVREAENKQWKSGMSSSVRVGVEAIVATNSRITAVVLMLCDQPFVTRDIIDRLVRTHLEKSFSIVACRYGRSYGVPALFGKMHFAELMKLEGTGGAKKSFKNISAKFTSFLFLKARSTSTRAKISRG